MWLWIVQGLLALLCVAGGLFKVSQPSALAKQFPAVPRAAWRALGVVELAGGALLWLPMLATAAAGALVLETLLLSVVYARRSTQLTPANPLVFSVVMALLAGVVAAARV